MSIHVLQPEVRKAFQNVSGHHPYYPNNILNLSNLKGVIAIFPRNNIFWLNLLLQSKSLEITKDTLARTILSWNFLNVQMFIPATEKWNETN